MLDDLMAFLVLLTFVVVGIIIGTFMEWRSHRPFCLCESCKEWRRAEGVEPEDGKK